MTKDEKEVVFLLVEEEYGWKTTDMMSIEDNTIILAPDRFNILWARSVKNCLQEDGFTVSIR